MESKENCFFGYYDESQFSLKSTKVAVIRCSVVDDCSDAAVVEILSFPSMDIIYSITTNAWNFQQGCRLVWSRHDDNVFAFNDFVDGSYVRVQVDLRYGSTTTCSHPILSVDKASDRYLTTSYEVFDGFRPGYSYDRTSGAILASQYLAVVDPEKDFTIEWQRQVSDVVSSLGYTGDWLAEHAQFSGAFIFFFLRQFEPLWITKLIIMHVGSGRCEALDIARASHFYVNKDVLIGFGSLAKRTHKARELGKKYLRPMLDFLETSRGLQSLRKKVRQDQYFAFKFKFSENGDFIFEGLDIGGRLTEIGLAHGDGHPSIFKSDLSPVLLLTDTYQIGGRRGLFLINLDSDQILFNDWYESLAEFDDTGFRCDLHPRFSFDQQYFSFDIFTKRGRRSVFGSTGIDYVDRRD